MKNLSVMIKPSSSCCNLQCKYCFYNSLASERSEFSHGMMSESTAKRIIDKAAEYSDDGFIFYVFQGGEPLMSGIDFFRCFFEYAEKNNINPVFSVQTNGTLIDDGFATLFRRHNVLVGVSLDGRKTENIYRVMKNGELSDKEALRGIAILKNHKVDFNILSVVTKYSSQYIIDIYNYFKNKGYRFLQFIPCLKPLASEVTDNELYMDEDDYYNYLSSLFEVYYDDALRGNYMSVRLLDNFVTLALGMGAEQCSMNGRCSEQYVIEGDGAVYPCDFYCTDEFFLGNINESDFKELSQSKNMVKFKKGASVITPECKKCHYVNLCRGTGCRRFKADGDMCSSYKRFFSKYENSIYAIGDIMSQEIT